MDSDSIEKSPAGSEMSHPTLSPPLDAQDESHIASGAESASDGDPDDSASRPTLVQTDTTLPPFVSAAPLSRWVIWQLNLSIILAIAMIGLYILQVELFCRGASGEALTAINLQDNFLRQSSLGIARMAVTACTILSFCCWAWRCHRNLPSLGARGMDYTPAATVGSFFVPLLNLVRPFYAIAETWKASNPHLADDDRAGWKGLTNPSLLEWWWATWIMTGCGLAINPPLPPLSDNYSALSVVTCAYLVLDVFQILCGVLAILVVREITARQEERWLYVNLAAAEATPAAETAPENER